MTEAAGDERILDEIVRRIVAVADPDRIILFGSRAREEAEEHSDYDILVIGPSQEARSRRTAPLYLTRWQGSAPPGT